MSKNDDDIVRLKGVLKEYRRKLLDLTARNPLLSAKIKNYKSNSYIRVIDERPEQVLERIYDEEKPMEFAPLPSNKENPKDEESENFKKELAEAMQSDEEYLQELESIEENREDSSKEEYEELGRGAERKLRDGIRIKLKMEPHLHAKPQKEFAHRDVRRHAKNNLIYPEYDLPEANIKNEDSRHSDNEIQTLLMPEVLGMRIKAVISKSREWKQEAGVNVLHAAFGFLEWKDSDNSKEHYAPLLLLPVTIEKKKGKRADVFEVRGRGENLEENLALKLKLKSDFGEELPDFDKNYSVENYFNKIIKFFEKKENFEVKRYIVFGVFPSQRIAMYNDLDPNRKALLENKALQRILLGSSDSERDVIASPYEYEDEIKEYHDAKKHAPVYSIDPSQFDVLQSAMRSENLIVEGPPGTGKSQTIVNIIAAALGAGKKVLFVAEKMAALEVVKARLDAIGLGEFTLPLQATKSGRANVIESIKKRWDMDSEGYVFNYQKKIEEFEKIKNELNLYCETITRKYKNTDLTIHAIMGKYIAEHECIDEHDEIFKNEATKNIKAFSKESIDELKNIGEELELTWDKQRRSLPYWANQKVLRRDPFSVGEIFDLTRYLASCYGNLSKLHEEIGYFGFTEDIKADGLDNIAETLKLLSSELVNLDFVLLGSLVNQDTLQKLQELTEDCKKLHELQNCSSSVENIQQFLASVEESGKLLVDDLLIAHDLVLMKTGVDILRLRPPENNDTDIEKQIGKLIRKMEKLQNDNRLGNMPEQSKIEDCYNEFVSSGLLSFIFPRYRKMKKEYMFFSAYKSFNKKKAIEELLNLKEQRALYDDYAEQLHEIFDDDVELSDAGLQKLQDLKVYYKSIAGKFPNDESQGIRDFLKFSRIASLMKIPDIEVIQKVLQVDKNCNLDKFKKEFFDLQTDLIDKITNDEEMKALLADNFSGVETDVSVFADEIRIANLLHDWQNKHFEDKPVIISMIAVFENDKIDDVCDLINKIQAQHDEIQEKADSLSDLDIAVEHLAKGKTYAEISDNLSEASKDEEGLEAHSRYNEMRDEIANKGFDWLVSDLLEKKYSISNFGKVLEVSIYRSYLRQIFSNQEINRVLEKYKDSSLSDLQKMFAKIDKDIITMHQKCLREKLLDYEELPIASSGKISELTEGNILKHEMKKVKGFIPARDLTKRAGKSLSILKPCWMMSPLAVAQYLPHGTVQFDLCIIDEASQMPPEEALGALSRCKQAIIVGDSNQLPPTPFFKRYSASEEDEEEVYASSGESILDLASNAFRNKKMLNWHYRSNDPSLIKFSNHMMYNDRLYVAPSPYTENENKGVSLENVEGIYTSGERINREEAKAVISAILKFMRTRADESLGVVTLNISQKKLLEQEWDHALHENSYDRRINEYLDKWETEDEGLNSFFIKNLENVQGDERDVIFISTVYGPAVKGERVRQNFGPISKAGGSRRLNVLFSRAKNQIITFTSMNPKDIHDTDKKNHGVHMLRKWLSYSVTGDLPLGEKSQQEPGSDFEIAVADMIKSLGYETDLQVSSNGFSIDIGVRHPEWEHDYIMGVECDGASYHSTKNARVRDYMRQQILESNDWHIYRVWSTDWFYNYKSALQKLEKALEERLDYFRNERKGTNNLTKTGTAPLEQDGNSDFELKSEETGFTFSSREE